MLVDELMDLLEAEKRRVALRREDANGSTGRRSSFLTSERRNVLGMIFPKSSEEKGCMHLVSSLALIYSQRIPEGGD